MGLCGAGGDELGRRPRIAPCSAFGGAAPPRARPAAGLTRHASPPGLTCRGLCAAQEPNVSYQELKDLKKANVLHIDVRERWEIDRFGKIPQSINIPRKLCAYRRHVRASGVPCSSWLEWSSGGD